MSSGRKAACCHWVPGLVFPPWCHHNGENHKYMLEFIEPENNTRDISLQNTLIAGSGRNTHLLLMGLRRVNVNLTLHSLDFYWVFIKKGFSGWISAWECRKEGVRRKSHLLWGKVMEEPGQFPMQTTGSRKEKFLILQQGLLIRASSERKLPKISPKCSCPCGTPAVPLQKGPLSPEGYLYSTSWERHLGHHPGVYGLLVLAHVPDSLQSLKNHGTRNSTGRGEKMVPPPQEAEQLTGDREYGCFPLPIGGTSMKTSAGSAKNWRLPSFLLCLILWWEQNPIQDLPAPCCGTNRPITHRCWPHCARESRGTALCSKQIISSYTH